MVQCLAEAEYVFSSPKYADGSESHPAPYAVIGRQPCLCLSGRYMKLTAHIQSSTVVENDWICSSIPPYTLIFMLYTRKTFMFCHSALWWGVDMAVHWNMIGWVCSIVVVCVSDTSCDNSMSTLHYYLVFISFCVFLSCQYQMWACNTKVCTELLLLYFPHCYPSDQIQTGCFLSHLL